MRTLHYKPILFLLISVLAAGSIIAQDSKKEKQKALAIERFVSSKDFDFVAEYVMPTGGGNIYLTSRYDMSVSKDTLSTYLPYYGRAYVAPIDPSEGGINFTSTRYTYTTEDRKKGGWNILISPKDTRDVRQLYLSVFEDGSATLQVISNNKQAISYTGYIRERKTI